MASPAPWLKPSRLDALLDGQRVTLDAALSYELPLDEIVSRLSGRRTCDGCRAVYHISASPPRAGAVCDRCGGRLVRREDDRPESIRVRMRAYEESTRPLLDYYQGRGKLLTIPARGTPAEILECSLNTLGEPSGAAGVSRRPAVGCSM